MAAEGEENKNPPGEEYEEIREQVRFFVAMNKVIVLKIQRADKTTSFLILRTATYLLLTLLAS